MKKLIVIFLLFACLFSFVSCDSIYLYPHPDFVRERFSSFESENKAGISSKIAIYTSQKNVTFEYLTSHMQNPQHIELRSSIVRNSKIYAVGYYRSRTNTCKIFVIEYDYLNNSSPITIFEKEIEFDSQHLSFGVFGGAFAIVNYLEYSGSKMYYYFYVVETGEFIERTTENLFEGKYAISYGRNFEITDRQTQTKKIVDHSIIKKSGYGKAFSKLSFYPAMAYQDGDTIVLAYFISASTNYGLNLLEDGYLYACFVYDFETEKLKFDSLLYPDDSESIYLSYSGKDN